MNRDAVDVWKAKKKSFNAEGFFLLGRDHNGDLDFERISFGPEGVDVHHLTVQDLENTR